MISGNTTPGQSEGSSNGNESSSTFYSSAELDPLKKFNILPTNLIFITLQII